jgi:hypothetical protein
MAENNAKITPKRGASRNYKGYAPLKADITIGWFLKMLLQVSILWLIYSTYIDGVKAQLGTNNDIVDFFVEVPFVIGWMLVSDACAMIVSWIVVSLYDYFNDYMKRKKEKTYFARRFLQYMVYTVIRSICYALGLVVLLSALLYPFLGLGPINFSFLFAWIVVSLVSRSIAWGVALYLSVQ